MHYNMVPKKKRIRVMYKISDIKGYENHLTECQKELVIKHCNEHNLEPSNCAIYDDIDDFCDDMQENNGYEETFAISLLKYDDIGEFIKFPNGSIAKFSNYSDGSNIKLT